jgi:hypothetical protein
MHISDPGHERGWVSVDRITVSAIFRWRRRRNPAATTTASRNRRFLGFWDEYAAAVKNVGVVDVANSDAPER